MSDQTSASRGESGRWYIVWRYGRVDPFTVLVLVALAGLLVAMVATGWAFGAAMCGLTIGFLLTLFAFTTNHFRMTERRHIGGPDARGEAAT